MRTITGLTLPERERESHKGQHGRVLIVGGSPDYTGAVVLAGLAALRCGADLVTVAAPEKVAWAANCLSADLVTTKLPGDILTEEHFDVIEQAKADVLLLGNGAGTDERTRALFRKLMALPQPKVLDADALKAVRERDCERCILTPHRKELETFLENSGSRQAALPVKEDPEELQTVLSGFIDRGNILLLKGAPDYVIGREIARNETGNPGMTKGGTGDVLAGLCAGYYAQLRDPWHAACNAAYLNGQLGDILMERKKGYTYLASDLVEELTRRQS